MKFIGRAKFHFRRPINLIITVVGCLYVCLLARPGFLFADVVTVGNISVYTHQPDAGLTRDIDRASKLLEAAPLRDTVAIHRLYLTNSNVEFATLAPGARHTFGATYPFIHSSFLATSNPADDTIVRDGSNFNRRPLSAVIAHEITHVVLEHHFGALRMMMAPAWKTEGYCDYISGGHSIGDDAAGLHILAAISPKQEPTQGSIAYFRGYTRIKYLLEQKHMTVDQIFTQTFDTTRLDREAIASLTQLQR
jgi:hypothetical protein